MQLHLPKRNWHPALKGKYSRGSLKNLPHWSVLQATPVSIKSFEDLTATRAHQPESRRPVRAYTLFRHCREKSPNISLPGPWCLSLQEGFVKDRKQLAGVSWRASHQQYLPSQKQRQIYGWLRDQQKNHAALSGTQMKCNQLLRDRRCDIDDEMLLKWLPIRCR